MDGIGAILGAPPDGAFGSLVTLPSEKRLETGGGIRICAFVGALKRSGRVGDVPAGPEDDPEPTGRLRMAGRVREPICPLCARWITTFFEHCAQVEGAVRIAVLVRALVAGLRRRQISACFEEHPEVERRASMAQRIGFAIGKFGAGQITPLFEQNPEVEPFARTTGTVDQWIDAPHHPPAILTVLSDDPDSDNTSIAEV